ncbi:hypothetical protein KDA_43240 [Dictyobacter alpinus]|uniref:Uncharacterized protein n=1 Tax=Dictyobacter alpinus TaxID=2014873 RepID=A0A402BC13_9CHLR|nr:hypothetical protein KDA_43240 [Dictyobacter alpinus]
MLGEMKCIYLDMIIDYQGPTPLRYAQSKKYGSFNILFYDLSYMRNGLIFLNII